MPYVSLREHLPPDTRYVTFLREPVDRVLSHYYRNVHRPELTLADRAARRRQGRATAASVEEALVDQQVPELNNLATRFLCGHPSPMGELPASALEDAKANLREFAFVGIQERFDESIVLLRRMLGLDLVPHLNANVSVDRPALGEISDEQRALIAQSNRLDAELYAFALELFEDAVAAADEGFAADAEALRASSAEANAAAIERAREWLDLELPAGTTKPKHVIYAAATETGIPIPSIKHVGRLASVKIERDDDGRMTWTRTEEPRSDISNGASPP